MSQLTDTAWRAITGARGGVQGKALMMTRGTMAAICFDRGETWNPLAHYRLYGVRVRYDDHGMYYGQITLEEM